MSSSPELDELRALIERQQQQLDAQQRQIESLSRPRTPVEISGDQISDTPSADPVRVGRRGALRVAGAAALGAAADATVLAQPAAAADTDPYTAGGSVDSNTATSFNFVGPAGDPSANTTADFLFQDDNDWVPSSSSFDAVMGVWTSGDAVEGQNALYTYSTGGDGIISLALGSGTKAGYGLNSRGTRANLLLTPEGDQPTDRVDDHAIGEVLADTNGDLWYCYAAGTPGSWRRLAGPGTQGGLSLLTTPTRPFDSRDGREPLTVPKGKIAGLYTADSGVIDLSLGSAGLPPISGALVNVTVTNTEGTGFLRLWADGAGEPTTSTINWFGSDQNIANTTVVATSETGGIQARSAGATDFIIDLIGYYT